MNHTKKFSRKRGNFLVFIAFLCTALIIFLGAFSSMSRSYFTRAKDAEYIMFLGYAVESVIERLPFDYHGNNVFNPAKTIQNVKEAICQNHSFSFWGANLEQSVLDFGRNCALGGSIDTFTLDTSGIYKSATRMVNKEEYLDRFSVFEYRLTDAEFLEKKADGTDYAKPAKIRIRFFADDGLPHYDAELILVSMNKTGVADPVSPSLQMISGDIRVQRVPLLQNKVQVASGNILYYDVSDISTENDSPFDFTKKSYILFVRTNDTPLHIELEGRSTTGGIVSIPSRYLFLRVSAYLEDDQDSFKNTRQTKSAKKQLYTDFDSNFPYGKYELLPKNFQ